MNYSDLRKSIQQRTIKLIDSKNWEKILSIFYTAPEQIYYIKTVVEEKLKDSVEFNESHVEKIIYENDSQDDPNIPFVYYKFTKIFNLIFELLRIKNDFFSQRFKNQLSEILYPKISSFLRDKRKRISSHKKFIKSLYPEIREKYSNQFIDHPFMLEYLNGEKPEDLVELFPQLISKGYFRLGYELILNFNNLIRTHDSDTRKILENIILYQKQYNALKELLEKENNSLIKIMEDSREKLKTEFYTRFINYTRESIDSESFNRNPEDTFRYTYELFSKSELKSIIEKIIELKIQNSYNIIRNEHSWIHLILLDIAWAKDSNLFKEYLEDLVKLGHLQVGRSYFGQFPTEIKKNKDFILENLGYFTIDLLKWHYESFEFINPANVFKDLLHKDISVRELVLIFYNNEPKYINQFKDVIKNFIETKIEAPLIDERMIYTVNGLLDNYYRGYSNRSQDITEIDLSLLEKVYKLYVSKSVFKRFNAQIHDFTLAINFNQLEGTLQENLLDQLIESNHLTSIEFLLTFGYSHLAKFLGKIIAYVPKNDIQSEQFLRILDFILSQSGIDEEIREKMKIRVQDQVSYSKKAEIYSILGEFDSSKKVLKLILTSEIIIPHMINSYLDYQLVSIEMSINDPLQYNFSSKFDELSLIESDFKMYNTNQGLLQNFKFKLNSLKARIKLQEGLVYIQDLCFMAKISRDCFKSSFQI